MRGIYQPDTIYRHVNRNRRAVLREILALLEQVDTATDDDAVWADYVGAIHSRFTVLMEEVRRT